MKFRPALYTCLLALAGIAAACGSDTKSETEEASATPSEAIKRIDNVRSGLEEALASYKAGNKNKADQIAGDTYLEQFEHVEGPLDKADHELKEQLEDGIREELRGKIKAGASTAEVEAYVKQLNAKLTKAEAALR